MSKGPYISPSTGARKIGGINSSTRSPNVSNVFSHIRTVSSSASAYGHRFQGLNSDEDWESDELIDGCAPHRKSEYFKRYELMIEFINLKNNNHCPLGLYIVPSEENQSVWYGVIFVHQGFYKSGAFKFRVAIPETYPEHPPIVTFMSDMFHPLIDGGGNLNLSQQFPTWRPFEDYILHVLHYVKNIFKKVVLDRLMEKYCYNKESYRMYRTERKTFIMLSEQCAKLSITESYLYDHFPDDNMIRFAPLSESKYEEIRKQIFKDDAIIQDEVVSNEEEVEQANNEKDVEEVAVLDIAPLSLLYHDENIEKDEAVVSSSNMVITTDNSEDAPTINVEEQHN